MKGWAAWRGFLFTPIPVFNLAIFRIVFGLVLLLNVLILAPDLGDWYGTHGIVSLQNIQAHMPDAVMNSPFKVILNTDARVAWIFTALIIAIVTMTFGLLTNLSAFVVFFCLFSFHVRNPLLHHGYDDLMRIFALYLALSPAGRCLSLDSLWHSWRNGTHLATTARAWPLRLLQIQVAMVYFFAGIAKLRSDAWLDGSAVYFVTRIRDVERFHLPYVLDHLWTLRLMTWTALAFEISFPFLIWNRRTRWLVLATGIAFHGSLELVCNLGLWHWLMPSTYFLFLSDNVLMAFFARQRKQIAEFPLIPARGDPLCP